MSSSSFPVEVIEQLGFYVYVLADPEGNVPFYVGKGHGNRIFEHSNGKLTDEQESDKIRTIKKIIKAGREVTHYILRHGLTSLQALEYESMLIDFCQAFDGVRLDNIARGYGTSDSGIMTAHEIREKYLAPLLTSLDDPCVLININRQYKSTMDMDAIYEATRRAWVIGKRARATTKYALAEHRGFIVGVFEIDEWKLDSAKKDTGKPDRYAFIGTLAPEGITQKYLNKRLPRRGGAQNPIRFSIRA